MWDSLEGAARHIPTDVGTQDGESLELHTSGLGGDIPGGIPVGELAAVEPEVEGLFQSGRVRLDSGLRSLREVSILIPLAARD